MYFKVQIMELKPADAVNIIECDMNVDFEAPVGYQDRGSLICRFLIFSILKKFINFLLNFFLVYFF